MEVSQRLWERAFQLSYFVLMDRTKSRECLARALEKLAVQRTREKRRSYWRGRKKELTIRRISRSTDDTLQWLVCLESETWEKEQESHGQPTEADMVVRYVKHLAQMTTANSSFHVNVGFNRLLRNYSTPEVQQLYELATVRYPPPEEYRKAKGKLLNSLVARFERFLKVQKGQYGELQLETHEEYEVWSGLVEACLEMFAPWSAGQSCLRDGSELAGVTSERVARTDGVSSVPDRVETNRCHWFMHSTCCGRLVGQLGLDPPEERLAVPRFLHHADGGPGVRPPVLERRASPLSVDEARSLHERVALAAGDGKAVPSVSVRIVAGGMVCATLDLGRNERRRFEIPDGTRLLEVRTDVTGEGRILATHWVDYAEDGRFLAGEYTIAVQGGRQLTLSVVPDSVAGGQGPARAYVTINSGSVFDLRERLRSLRVSLAGEPGAFLRPVLASLALVAVGVVVSSLYFAPKLSQDRLVIGRMTQENEKREATITALEHAPTQPIQTVVHFAFSSASSGLRGPGEGGEPVVTFASGAALAVLELPVNPGTQTTYRVTLSAFPAGRERLSEPALTPVKRGERWIVEFALPAAMVESDTHYLLAMTQADGESEQHYLFEVRKR